MSHNRRISELNAGAPILDNDLFIIARVGDDNYNITGADLKTFISSIIPTALSELTNDTNFVTLVDVKADTDIANTISNSHTHSNKSDLDNVSGTNTGDNSFTNGLTAVLKTVSLGGDLVNNTDINASASNYYLRYINRSNGSYFGIYRDANGSNIFRMENPNIGNAASNTMYFYNNLGLTTQFLGAGGNYAAQNNAFIFDKISGNFVHVARSGEHQFYTDGFLGTLRMKITNSGVEIGDVLTSGFYLPTSRSGNNNYVLKTDATSGTSWDSITNIIGYTPEDEANKVTAFQVTPDNTHYPSEKLVKDSIDAIDESKWQDVTTNVPYNYGMLYNWYAVNTGKLAPTGYSIPSKIEFETLSTYLGGNSISGGKLKSDRVDPIAHPRWTIPNSSATNDFSFNLLPSGYRRYDGGFTNIGNYGNLWTTTDHNATDSYILYSYYNNATITFGYVTKSWGHGVRFFRAATVGEQALADGTIIEYAQDADGNYYPMVKIGTQVWSTQNLKTTQYNDNTPITNITDGTTWSNSLTEAYCSYGNNPLSTYEDPTFYYTVVTNFIEPKSSKQILITDVYQQSGINTGDQTSSDFDHNSLQNTHNLTTDIEISTIADVGNLKATWSGKQDALGFTPEDVANKENTTLDNSTTKYPTNNLTKNSIDSAKAFAVAMACAL